MTIPNAYTSTRPRRHRRVPAELLMPRLHRRYVTAGGRTTHYRICGEGPPVVLLHDSPRSSRLHIGTMAALAENFTVFALDTPGYGNSAPLGISRPVITDFAEALGETLAALGLMEAPLYATHTSAKIALALAVRGGRMTQLVLDGLSLPEKPADDAFIDAYMRPFRIDDAGAYLAAEWSHLRDMLRWFPWFSHGPASRLAMPEPSAEWLADYLVDMMSAGPHYADAYAAAMRWNPMPDLLAVEVPTIVTARPDDVLYRYLNRVPQTRNRALKVERPDGERDTWIDWLRSTLHETQPTPALPVAVHQAHLAKCEAAGYADFAHGQLHWQRFGEGNPTLILSAPTTMEALRWSATTGNALVPDLPGFGESDPMPDNSAERLADVLAELIRKQAGGRTTVIGCGMASPLAAQLAIRHPDTVAHLVIDGAPPLAPASAARFDRLYPVVDFDPVSGAHLHRIWHILRDSQIHWPWHDRAPAANRLLPPLIEGVILHEALTGVLKQPRTWGQTCDAALMVTSAGHWSGVKVPTTVLNHADPAYTDATAIASLIPQARLVDRTGDPASLWQVIISGKEAQTHG